MHVLGRKVGKGSAVALSMLCQARLMPGTALGLQMCGAVGLHISSSHFGL